MSVVVEKTSSGFALTPADQQAPNKGETLTLSHGGADHIAVALVGRLRTMSPGRIIQIPGQSIVVDGWRWFELCYSPRVLASLALSQTTF